MEFIGAVSEGEWSSLSGMYTAEEADFMAQLIGNCPFSSMGVTEANFWPGHESTMNNMAGSFEGSHFSSETINSNLYKISQGDDCSDQRYYLMSTESDHPMLVPNNRIDSSMSIDFGTGDVKNINSYLIEGDHDQCLNQETSEGNAQEYAANRPEAAAMGQKRYELTIQEPAKEDKSTNPTKSMKRSQSTENVQMTKRNIKSKKGLHVETRNYEEDGNAGPNRQSSGSCCSGDDTIASHGNEHSQELSGGMTSPTSSLSSKEASALNLSGKSRARRGSATDPQSLYARKRREKINERLRVLQGLVPNGTKVDISTMLEEAVHYVKFLQLQIKLLSSDDMWMYAPICYNGMDLGLDMKLTPPKQ